MEKCNDSYFSNRSRIQHQEPEHSAKMKKLQKKLLDSQMNQIQDIRRLGKTPHDMTLATKGQQLEENSQEKKRVVDDRMLNTMYEHNRSAMIEDIVQKQAKQNDMRKSMMDDWERSIKINQMKKQFEKGNFSFTIDKSATTLNSFPKSEYLSRYGKEVEDEEDIERSKLFELERRRRASTQRKKNPDLFAVDPFESVERERNVSQLKRQKMLEKVAYKDVPRQKPMGLQELNQKAQWVIRDTSSAQSVRSGTSLGKRRGKSLGQQAPQKMKDLSFKGQYAWGGGAQVAQQPHYASQKTKF